MEFLIRVCSNSARGSEHACKFTLFMWFGNACQFGGRDIFFRQSSNGRRSGQLKLHRVPLLFHIASSSGALYKNAARRANEVSDYANDVVNIRHMMAVEPFIYALSHLDGDGGVDEIGCADFNCGGPGHDKFNGIGGIHNTA